MSGLFASARASATRCCCPPESWAGAAAHPEFAHELVGGPPGIFPAPADQQQRQLDVLNGGQGRQQVEELEDEADLAATQASELRLAQPVDPLAV
jgi:hypothetical protein